MDKHDQLVFVVKHKLSGEEWFLEIEDYTTLREFVTSEQFLSITSINPNTAIFFVNGERAEDDFHLMPGDEITMHFPSYKSALSSRELIKKLKKMVGLSLCRRGSNHDIWITASGKKIPIPVHARDLSTGTLAKIIKEAGLDMSLSEFISYKY